MQSLGNAPADGNAPTRDEARRIALNIAKIPAYRRGGATS
jgi:hypothetical protein